ncbi:hypothetical protein BWP39_29155 [Paraburkholderia acidicola]|uniref:Suppressor of fused-like domain-containing protein n=1 Tax=Paraburkholderia acidicola TaxID=1912599 RepID=A0A2A4ETL5_9BURK|nr:suppressor of fused domain protein [Paraburkholderia acidicola]PCE23750.1 hypothetical protein BWP39_29155 [Paraburkholderia acidicola]
MNQVSSAAKAVANYTAAAFGVEKPPIFHLWDDDHKSDIYVLEASDCPQKGVISYATIGLSGYPLIRNGEEFNARVEFLGACGSIFPGFNKILATLSFCVINSKWFCAPGVIFPGVMDMYDASTTMSDIYFANPFLWDDRFKSVEIGEKTTAWLLAVPISKKETEYAKRYGSEKLEELFSEKDIDIFNLNRASVV